MNWTDIWKGPFKNDHYGYIWDNENTMVFTVDDLTEENDKWMNSFCNNIVNVLNGNEPTEKYAGLEIKDGCDLYINDEMIGYFRGWGHLTGGLKLTGEEAVKLQDSLIEFVLNKISE